MAVPQRVFQLFAFFSVMIAVGRVLAQPAEIIYEEPTPEVKAEPVKPIPTPSLTISDAVVATDVKALTPAGSGNLFDDDIGSLVFFTRVNGAQQATAIRHIWFFGEKQVSTAVLSIKSPSWRTYSRLEIRPDRIGDWHVDAVDNHGTVLISRSFTIQATTR